MANPSAALLIAADHAGADLKEALKKLLSHQKWEDMGAPLGTGPVDYPDYAISLGQKVAKENRLGVLICGSGVGMSIAANKIAGVRAAVVTNPVAARWAREHNAANVLCLGARFLAPQYAAEIVRAWLEASPSTEPRHLARIKKITDLDS